MKTFTPEEIEICWKIADRLGMTLNQDDFFHNPGFQRNNLEYLKADRTGAYFPLLSLEDAIEEMEKRGYRIMFAPIKGGYFCYVYNRQKSPVIDMTQSGATHREAALKCLLTIVESKEER